MCWVLSAVRGHAGCGFAEMSFDKDDYISFAESKLRNNGVYGVKLKILGVRELKLAVLKGDPVHHRSLKALVRSPQKLALDLVGKF